MTALRYHVESGIIRATQQYKYKYRFLLVLVFPANYDWLPGFCVTGCQNFIYLDIDTI